MSRFFTDKVKVEIVEILDLDPKVKDKLVKDLERHYYTPNKPSPLNLNDIKSIKSRSGSPIYKSGVDTRDSIKKFIEDPQVKEISNKYGALLWEYFVYLVDRAEVIDTYQTSESWGDVIQKVYQDDYTLNEVFIDYVEEIYQVKIKDVKQLQKLTGITYLVPAEYEGEDPYPDKEGKINAIKELGDSLLLCKENKYLRALEIAVEDGAKYKDLLKILPKDYGLPDTWESVLHKDQFTAIAYTIRKLYFDGIKFPMITPSLRDIAEDLGAPLSVVLEAYKQ